MTGRLHRLHGSGGEPAVSPENNPLKPHEDGIMPAVRVCKVGPGSGTEDPNILLLSLLHLTPSFTPHGPSGFLQVLSTSP